MLAGIPLAGQLETEGLVADVLDMDVPWDLPAVLLRPSDDGLRLFPDLPEGSLETDLDVAEGLELKEEFREALAPDPGPEAVGDDVWEAAGLAPLGPLTKATRFFLRFKDDIGESIPDIDHWPPKGAE